jgi:cytochrome bd-type quinol oxidase subunit 2
MLLQLDSIPRLHNIIASFSTWILLAGYLVFPATFNSIQHNQQIDQQFDSGVKARILSEVRSVESLSSLPEARNLANKVTRNVPLLYVAAIACGIGCLSCLWLWQLHRQNYIWLTNRIFLPVFMNSLAGLISTFVNVYSAQTGQYSITAKVTMIVTGACTAVGSGLFLLYNNWALERVKKQHKRENESVERELMEREMARRDEMQRNGIGGRERRKEGFFARMTRKVNQPGLEPESVV